MSGQAACAGMWDLFDSTEQADHREAYALCMTCPILEDCRTLRINVLRDSGSYGKPEGTWAGQLLLDPRGSTWTLTPKHRKADQVDEAVIERWFNGENLPTTRAERVVITRRWLADGGGWGALERRSGWKPERYVPRRENEVA